MHKTGYPVRTRAATSPNSRLGGPQASRVARLVNRTKFDYLSPSDLRREGGFRRLFDGNQFLGSRRKRGRPLEVP